MNSATYILATHNSSHNNNYYKARADQIADQFGKRPYSLDAWKQTEWAGRSTGESSTSLAFATFGLSLVAGILTAPIGIGIAIFCVGSAASLMLGAHSAYQNKKFTTAYENYLNQFAETARAEHFSRSQAKEAKANLENSLQNTLAPESMIKSTLASKPSFTDTVTAQKSASSSTEIKL